MTSRLPRVSTLALLTLPLFPVNAMAQLAVSANDNKAVLIDGVTTVVQNPPPDTVTIIDLKSSPPKIVGSVNAPASVVGPPSSVAVAHDESLALVSAATQIDRSDPTQVVHENSV